MVERPEHLVGTDVAIYEDDDGTIRAMDYLGEYDLDPPAGDDEPQDGRCGVPLRKTMRRYGEIRYCGGMPVGTFVSDDRDVNYTYMDRCKMHQNRGQVMKNAIELLEHGAFSRNYVIFEQSLDASEFLFATEMFGGLLGRSEYDYEVEEERRKIDTSDDDLIEEDEVVVTMPIPTSDHHQLQANELWLAALDEVKEQRMQHAIFTDGVSVQTLTDSADMDGRITDKHTEKTEHSLHLPISRLSKDIKERLKVGGVEVGAEDEDGGLVKFQRNDYTLSVEPPDEDEDVEEIDSPLTTQLEPDDE